MCTNTKKSSLIPTHIKCIAETNGLRSCVDVQCCEFIANIAIVNKSQFVYMFFCCTNSKPHRTDGTPHNC